MPSGRTWKSPNLSHQCLHQTHDLSFIPDAILSCLVKLKRKKILRKKSPEEMHDELLNIAIISLISICALVSALFLIQFCYTQENVVKTTGRVTTEQAICNRLDLTLRL